jgi:hypothetical protein
MPIFEPYCSTRSRVSALVMYADEAELNRIVPACPEWKVRDLLTHLVSIPAALSRGRLPDGELNAWLAGLIAERPLEPVGALVAEWESLNPACRRFSRARVRCCSSTFPSTSTICVRCSESPTMSRSRPKHCHSG